MSVKCRRCDATTWLLPEYGLPPGWKSFQHDDYLDEFECDSHE